MVFNQEAMNEESYYICPYLKLPSANSSEMLQILSPTAKHQCYRKSMPGSHLVPAIRTRFQLQGLGCARYPQSH